MASIIKICNLALARIGQASITSLTEDSEEAVACNLLYDEDRRALLEDHSWNFATKQVYLTPTDTEPAAWKFEYALPVSCLRIIKLVNLYSEDIAEYEILNRDGVRYLYTNEEDAMLEYVDDVQDVNLFSTGFITSLSYRLGASLAMAIARRADIAQSLFNLSNQLAYKAKGINAREQGKMTKTFLDARR